MKFLFDVFPTLLFFCTFKWSEGNNNAIQVLVSNFSCTSQQVPLLLATVVTIFWTIGQIGYLLLRKKKIDTMVWVSLFIMCIFGGASMYFHNEKFIKCKPTFLYWIFGLVLLISQILKKNLIQTTIGNKILLPEKVWGRISLLWSVFFIALGFLNLYVALHFSTVFWVNFKIFGCSGLMLIFLIGQTIILSKSFKD